MPRYKYSPRRRASASPMIRAQRIGSSKRGKQEELRKPMEPFKKGDVDPFGNLITRIFVSRKDYVIYEIESPHVCETIRVFISDRDENLMNKYWKALYEFFEELNEVKAILHKARRENAYKSLIATAVSRGIEGNPSAARNELRGIATEIGEEYKRHFISQMVYFLTISGTSGIVIALSTLVYLGIIPFAPSSEVLRHAIYSVAFSGVGCSLSTAIKLKNLEIDIEAGLFLQVMHGIERLVISHAAGIIMYFLIYSNIALGFVNSLDYPAYATSVFCAIAGFSERFVPDLLRSIEKTNSKPSGIDHNHEQAGGHNSTRSEI